MVDLAEALDTTVSALLAEPRTDAQAERLDSMARSIDALSDADAEYAMEQFRHTVNYLKSKRQ